MNTIAVRDVRSRMHQSLERPKQSFVYITELRTAVAHAEKLEQGSKVIAVDTEHYNFSHHQLQRRPRFPYAVKQWNSCGPFVAILQVSTMEETYIFDILALGFLPAKLEKLLKGNTAVKLVFDECAEANAFKNSFGFTMVNVLDMQIVSLQLAHGQLIRGVQTSVTPASSSLASVVAAFLGESMDKTYQRFRWTNVDVPFAALRYAAEDAMVLLQLLQFIVTTCRCAWAARPLDGNAVNDVLHHLVQKYGSDGLASVNNRVAPATGVELHRLFRVRRIRQECYFD